MQVKTTNLLAHNSIDGGCRRRVRGRSRRGNVGYVADDDAWRRLVPEPRYEWMQVTIYGANVECQSRGVEGAEGAFTKGSRLSLAAKSCNGPKEMTR